MDATLPPTVRLSLDNALAQWRTWSPAPGRAPQAIATLSGGLSNTSIKVGDGERCWVLRIDGVEPARLGLRRDVEWRLLQQAADIGLAPRPVYRNTDLGVLVCEYHQADSLAEAAAGSTAEIENTALLLRQIHTLPAVDYSLDPLQRARLYLNSLGINELPGRLMEACQQVSSRGLPPALCHNDLLRANRLLSKGRLLALDWEYAAMGDPLFDLAAIIEGDALSEGAAGQLHDAWLGRQATDREQQHLYNNRVIYSELAALWELVNQRPAPLNRN